VAGVPFVGKEGLNVKLGDPGFEYTFIIAAICLALIFLGPGKFSLMNK
jgi:uncharacterized membrane protein YphA (DoxX/SURF4 family)